MASTLRLTLLAGAIFLAFMTTNVGAADPGGLQVDRAWARATPGSSRTGAAYFTIFSPVDDRLISLASPVAGKAELHTHVEENGAMRMRAVEGGLAIPANQQVELKPGGRLHVMLIELNQKLTAGDRFPLILTFEKAGTRDVSVKVEPLGAIGPAGSAAPRRNTSGADHNNSTDTTPDISHSTGKAGR